MARKLSTLLLCLMACVTLHAQSNYTITGTLENGREGDRVLLHEEKDGKLSPIDTAYIVNGTFVFTGRQDSTVSRYLTASEKTDPIIVGFFLEKGDIRVRMKHSSPVVMGTPNNEAYQAVRDKVSEISQRLNIIYNLLDNNRITEKQYNAKLNEEKALRLELVLAIRDGIVKNINSPVGITLFKQNYKLLLDEENLRIIELLPPQYASDPEVIAIKEKLNKE